jgi:hypothetical protein
LAPAFGLVDVAREIEAADGVLAAVASAELEAIARHIRALRAEAEAVLERTRRDAELHRADCRFQKRAGEVYHLYCEPSGRRYFSLLSPGDWRGSPPHAFEGSFRLGLDMRWAPEPAPAVAEREPVRRLGSGTG